MGMAIDGEGRAAAATSLVPSLSEAVETAPPSIETPAPPSPPTPSTTGDVAGTHGECETSEQKARRLRSNSEETALILTSMMSMSKFAAPPAAAPAARRRRHDSDDDEDGSRHSDMGEDMSDDEQDQDGAEFHGKGKGRAQHVQFGGAGGSKLDFLDEAGFSHRFRNESNRVKSLVTKHISIDELREHFDRPIIDVAKDFGICITLMKKICRRNGIKRWPHRQIRSLSKSIASMEAAMLSSQGPEREKYRDQILSLKLKRDSVIADPNKENSMTRPKTPTKDGTSRPHTHVHAVPKLSPRSSTPANTPVGGPVTKTDGQSHSKGGRWTSEEHAAFLHGIRLYGKDWRRVAQVVRTRSAVQTRTHAQKYLLKFAGRFPFDAEGLELKTESNATAIASSADVTEPRGDTDDALMPATPTAAAKNSNEKETDGGDTASMSSSSHDDDAPTAAVTQAVTSTPERPTPALTVDTANANPSALETMAMILNSPQFGSPQFSGSYRKQVPPSIETQSLAANDSDVAMESPRGSGVPATLPLLPSFVIKPGSWPSQQPAKTESAASSPAP